MSTEHYVPARRPPTRAELRAELRHHLAATRDVPPEPVPPAGKPFVWTPLPAGPRCPRCRGALTGDWLARDGKTRICGACASTEPSGERPDTR